MGIVRRQLILKRSLNGLRISLATLLVWFISPNVAAVDAIRVPGTSNPWLAGMPAGTTAGHYDVAPDQSPVEVKTVPILPGSTISIKATGSVQKGPTWPAAGPDGDLNEISGTQIGSENGLSDVVAPKNSLLGVFLGPEPPFVFFPTPGRLSFATSASRDYLTISPALRQVFFIGDGLTSFGIDQGVIVPAGATRLFLGTMDGFGWFNNAGSFAVEITADVPAVSVPDVIGFEGDSSTNSVAIVVRLSAPSRESVTVQYSTADGTAHAWSDYIPGNGTINFSPGETNQIIYLSIIGDGIVEPDETVLINLSSPTNAILAAKFATLTILNDDRSNLPPKVEITSPSDDAKFFTGEPISIQASAADPDGSISGVEFFVDGTSVARTASEPYKVPWTNPSVGDHILLARASDNFGLTGESAPVRISVTLRSRIPPTVKIVNPQDRTVFLPGNDINIVAAASAPEGTISQVEYFAGTQRIGFSKSPPFRMAWTNVLVGDYVLTARATDDSGLSASSEPVRVVVSEMSGDVAIIRTSLSPEIDKLQDYLFEMGLSSRVFDSSNFSYDQLAQFKLIIWDDLGNAAQILTETSVAVFSRAFSNNIPLYFIGENLANAATNLSAQGQAQWMQLVRLEPKASKSPTPRQVVITPSESMNPIARGRFGDVPNFPCPNPAEITTVASPDAQVFGTVDGAPVLVGSPGLEEIDKGEVRTFTQDILVSQNGDSSSQEARKELFQNVVCWLIRCAACSAVDISLRGTGPEGPVRAGDDLALTLILAHNGECEAIGVIVTNDLPTGV